MYKYTSIQPIYQFSFHVYFFTNCSEVTPILPICVRPVEQFITCRAIQGMTSPPGPNGYIPTWFDYNRARRGQLISSEYRLSWYTNMFNGILVEMNMPDVLNFLLFNRKNTDGLSAAKRDLATIMQGMIWTKDYFWRMPQKGQSDFITSIESVRLKHQDVRERSNVTLRQRGCTIFPEDYAKIPTNDQTWNAFERDMELSPIPKSQRSLPPSHWPTCAGETDCTDCGNRCSSNCEDICLESSGFFPQVEFRPGEINTLQLNNALILEVTLRNGTILDKGELFSPVIFSGGLWVSGRRVRDKRIFLAGDITSGTISEATVVKGSYNSKSKVLEGKILGGLVKNASLDSGMFINVTICTVISKVCSDCELCAPCSWIPPNCFYANPPNFHCANCRCDENGFRCKNCTNCTNYNQCLKFPVPLFNQQAMSFVVYNLVGFVILWPEQIGINACEADLWALVQLWSAILGALGVDDNCNVLLHPDISTARIYFQKIFDIYVLPTLFHFDKQTRYMMDNVFQGLQLLTGAAYTPELLLCRFMRDFLQLPSSNICGRMNARDKEFDMMLTTLLIPSFMNNQLYRAAANIGIDSMFSVNSEVFFPGKCSDYATTATKCFA